MKPEWRKILSLRNTKNKIFYSKYNRPSSIQSAMNGLKDAGYIVWLDTAMLSNTVGADIYLLTPKGAKFCDDNGIVKTKY
jgi:hypothetical protein